MGDLQKQLNLVFPPPAAYQQNVTRTIPASSIKSKSRSRSVKDGLLSNIF